MSRKECSTGAVTSFPLQMALTATDTLYDTVSEPLTMDIQWATRSTPPIFTEPRMQGKTDEVGAGNTNLTTLRFLNNNYTVSMVQLIKASHKNWLVPASDQANNFEDFVVTFESRDTLISNRYITFVIPILRTSTQTNPKYLVGLSDPNTSGPFSLNDCFPSNVRTQFAYYATCLAGYGATAPTQNMYVFVSTSAISASTELMKTVLSKTGRTGTFGTFTSSFDTLLTSNVTTILTVENFRKYVMTTTQLLNYKNFKTIYPTIDSNIRQDDANAYQCVSIDPDAAIVDGKLNVDLKSGEVLTSVLSERDKLRAANSVTSSMEPGRLEKYMSSALGIVLSIVLFSTILYTILVQTGWFFSAEDAETVAQNNMFIGILRYFVLTLLAGFIGFVIGTMIS